MALRACRHLPVAVLSVGERPMFGFIPFAKTSKSIFPAVQHALSLSNREGFMPVALGRQLLFACALFSLIILAARPALSQQPTSLDFGSVTIGQFKDQVLTKTVYTEGVYAVFLFPPTIIGPDASDFQITVDGYAPDGYAGSYFQDTVVSVTIRFTPSKAGPEQATLVGNGYTILPYSTFNYTPVTLTGNGVNIPATISSFTLSPDQISVPGSTVNATVNVVGTFQSMTVSPAPGSLNGAVSPTFILTNTGTVWTAALPTDFLKLAQANPVTFIATGTRADGSQVTAQASLQVGSNLPPLSLSLMPDKATVEPDGTVTLNGELTNASNVSANDAVVTATLPANVTYVDKSADGITYDATTNTLTWNGSLPASPNSAPGVASFSFVVQVASDAAAASQLTFTATASCTGFQGDTQSCLVAVGDDVKPGNIEVFKDQSGLLNGKATPDLKLGTPPLSARVEPDPVVPDSVVGSRRPSIWLGVTGIEEANGATYSTDDPSVGGLLASYGLISPSVSPIYDGLFPQVGSALTVHVGFTYESCAATFLDDVLSAAGHVTVDDTLTVLNQFDQVSTIKKALGDLTDASKPKLTRIAKASRDLIIGLTDQDYKVLEVVLGTVFGKQFLKDDVKLILQKALPVRKVYQQFADLLEIFTRAGTFPPDLEVVFSAVGSKE